MKLGSQATTFFFYVPRQVTPIKSVGQNKKTPIAFVFLTLTSKLIAPSLHKLSKQLIFTLFCRPYDTLSTGHFINCTHFVNWTVHQLDTSSTVPSSSTGSLSTGHFIN